MDFWHPHRDEWLVPIQNLRQEATAVDSDLDRIEARLYRLERTCNAFFEVASRKLGITPEEMTSALAASSPRDATTKVCPHCHRPVVTKTVDRCLYCGADLG